MTAVHRVHIDYKNKVWDTFLKNEITILANEGYTVKIKRDNQSTSKINLDEPVFIELQKSSREKRKKLFCIFSGGVTVDSTGGELISYVTRVSYFEPSTTNPSRATHLYSCHYDMDNNKLLGHPLFHMQMSTLPAIHREAIEALFDVVEEENNNHCKLSHLRYPTPQMDMFRFILQLLADHFLGGSGDNEHEKDFISLAKILNEAQYLPKANVDKMLEKLKDSERLCSLAWYDVKE